MKEILPMKLNPALYRSTLTGTLALFFAVPAAHAMIASVYQGGGATETHNTEPTDYVSEIWNRTVTFSNGTGVYLGQAENGDYLFLTAHHVSSSQYFTSANIHAANGTTYALSITSTSHYLTNEDGTNADLSVVALSANSATASYLDSLGSIRIYTGTLESSTSLYTIGTGVSSNIGSSYTSGTRTKQWAQFTRDYYVANNTNYTYVSIPGNESGSIQTTCYVEKLSNKKTSFQACAQDSGSGVFVYSTGEWLLSGTLLAVGGDTTDATNIGYSEKNSSENPIVYQTFFADLSRYANQINAIMTIPEPSAFGLLAGTLALGVAASRRSRRKISKSGF